MGRDETDDWMNPPETSSTYTVKAPDYPRFLIERKRRVPYPPFEEWRNWASFKSREERDAELAKLRDEHPAWILHGRDELYPPMAYL